VGVVTVTTGAIVNAVIPPHDVRVSSLLIMGLFQTLVQSVAMRERAYRGRALPSKPSPILKGCQVSLVFVGLIVVGVLSAASFMGPAPAVGWVLITFVVGSVLVALVIRRCPRPRAAMREDAG
jgi:hypothetical protein